MQKDKTIPNEELLRIEADALKDANHWHSQAGPHREWHNAAYIAGAVTEYLRAANKAPAASPVIEGEEQKDGIPTMSAELSALSDMAAIDYGKWCENWIGSRPYDASHITEAHEQGQIWMWQKLNENKTAIGSQKGEIPEEIMSWIDKLHKEFDFENNPYTDLKAGAIAMYHKTQQESNKLGVYTITREEIKERQRKMSILRDQLASARTLILNIKRGNIYQDAADECDKWLNDNPEIK